MLNATNVGKPFLDALFNTSQKETAPTMTFSATLYMGLLTELPNADGTGYQEPSSSEYVRLNLIKKGYYNKNLLSTADTEILVEENEDGESEEVQYAYVTNQEHLVMAYAKSADFGTIKGVGIFKKSESTEPGDVLLAWGKAKKIENSETGTKEYPTITTGEMPIIIEEDFKFRLA